MKEHNYYLIHNFIPLNRQLIRGELSIINFIKYSINLFKVYVYEILYEYIIFGISTSDIIDLNILTINSENINEGRHYRPTHYFILKKIFYELKSWLKIEEAFIIDYGSGLGRIILFGLNQGVAHAVGIEFAKELCDLCEQNINNSTNKDNYNIINIDAIDYELDSNKNIIFLFQPFSESIFIKVLDNIVKSQNILFIITIFDRYSNLLIKNGFCRLSEYK